MQDTLDDLFDQLGEGKAAAERPMTIPVWLYTLNLPEESQETFDFLEVMHQDVAKYYDLDNSVYVVGNSTSDL